MNNIIKKQALAEIDLAIDHLKFSEFNKSLNLLLKARKTVEWFEVEEERTDGYGKYGSSDKEIPKGHPAEKEQN